MKRASQSGRKERLAPSLESFNCEGLFPASKKNKLFRGTYSKCSITARMGAGLTQGEHFVATPIRSDGSTMIQIRAFWAAFCNGMASPVSLFVKPAPYYFTLRQFTVVESFAQVGTSLTRSPDDGKPEVPGAIGNASRPFGRPAG